MNRLFDPEAIKAQIANLLEDRQRIDQALNALQTALNNIEGLDQRQLNLAVPGVFADSVAASLINLAKGDNPMLKVAIKSRGRSPAFYSTEGTTVHRLSADEIETLMDETSIKGTGGWQSLWIALQKQFDKATGSIALTPELRARIYNYYHYGTGGWQTRVMRVFRRELPHLFIA